MVAVLAIVLTFNEEIHLPPSLASIHPISATVTVADSGPTNRTIERGSFRRAAREQKALFGNMNASDAPQPSMTPGPNPHLEEITPLTLTYHEAPEHRAHPTEPA